VCGGHHISRVAFIVINERIGQWWSYGKGSSGGAMRGQWWSYGGSGVAVGESSGRAMGGVPHFACDMISICLSYL